MESWYREGCPKCEALNLVYNGDESDLTRPDVDAVRCWKCKSIWSTEDKKLITEDDAYWIEDGVKEIKNAQEK